MLISFIIFILNIIGLTLEIIGFILMIKAEKSVEVQSGGFQGDTFVYSDTRLPVKKTQILGNHNMFTKGIIFVIVGLSCQILGLSLNYFITLGI